jgi:hypothetical protein
VTAKPRKLWATSFRGVPDKRRHESKAVAYRYVQNATTNYAAGVRYRTTHVNVWVDERGGRGWELYETVDLAELAGMKEGA